MDQTDFLLCRPEYFGVFYQINPWMDVKMPASNKIAMLQWTNLCRVLIEVGANLHFIPPQPGLPDMVFVANAGSMIRGKFIPSRFRWPQRQGEEPLYRDYIHGRSCAILPLSPSYFFEGEGDLLPFRNVYFAGYGIRSDKQAHEEIIKKMEVPIELLRLVNPNFYHLDTCFFPLDDRSALYYPPAFDVRSRKKIERFIPDAIAVGEEDALSFSCNGIRMGRHVLLNKATPALKSALFQRGFVAREVPAGEFIKAGGSVKCMVLSYTPP